MIFEKRLLLISILLLLSVLFFTSTATADDYKTNTMGELLDDFIDPDINRIVLDLSAESVSLYSSIVDFTRNMDVVESIISLAAVFGMSSSVPDSFEFNVSSGESVLNLNTTYDGAFVSAINGTLLPFVSIPGEYMRVITFNAAESMDNVLINITITGGATMTGRNPDWSNVWFYYSANFTPIPFYINNHSATNANVSLRLDTTAGTNSILMIYGGNEVSTKANISDLYLYYLNNSSGLVISENTTFYDGVYTNIIFRTQSMLPVSSYYFTLNNMGNKTFIPDRIPWFRFNVVSTVNVTAERNLDNTVLPMLGTQPITGVYQINASYLSNGSIMFSSNVSVPGGGTSSFPRHIQALQDMPFQSFDVVSDSTFGVRLFDIRIYNATAISLVSIGREMPVYLNNAIPVSPSPPTGQFSSLLFYADYDGHLVLDIFYEPHVVLLTPNGTSFAPGNVRLEYISHFGDLQVTYQISHDINFNDIILSGLTSDGLISIDLAEEVYYWRIVLPDGSFTETRRFIVKEPPESGYPLSLLIIPFIFAAWPILSRRSNRSPAETFVAITMGTMSCLTIAYMLMAGIIVGGITYNTMFLAFPMIPVCFYYLYMFLKNVIDNKEKVRKPIS